MSLFPGCLLNVRVHVQQRDRSGIERFFESQQGSIIVVTALTALAFALRFYKISHPDQVVYVCIPYPLGCPVGVFTDLTDS